MRPLLLVLLATCAAAQEAPAQEAPPQETPAQEAPPQEAPRVGLVLSGGAARGIAHVGAMRVIEDAGIPVDVVAGTSMGAVVGGLYAAGYSVDSLDAIVRQSDWAGLFTDARDRRGASPEARLGESDAALSFPIEGGTPGLPSGLVAGQAVLDKLTRLAWPVQDVRDFRRLPRPFAAVVVDAGTGDVVRLTSGSLPLAIRASLSIPTLFAPVEIDGRLYVDGGIARNLPAEDARALGADVLVCVDVTETAPGGARPMSILDVLLNAVFYRADRSLAEQQARCDVLIRPDIDGLGPAAFASAEAWIDRGAEAAEAQRGALDSLAARLGARRPTPAPVSRPARVEAVRVEGVSGPAARLVRERLAIRTPARLTAEALQSAVRRVVSTGAFALVTTRIDAPGDSGAAVPTLVVTATPAEGDRLGVGFRYDTDYDAALLFTLGLRDVGTFGSLARLDVRLGEQTQLQAGYVARVSPGVSVAAQAGYNAVPVQFFDGGDRARASSTLDVVAARLLGGPVLFGDVLTGVGPSAEVVRASPEVGPDSLETATWTVAALEAFAAADSRDRRAFASRGVRVLASAEASPGLGARFAHASLDAEGYVPLGAGVSVGARAALALAVGSDVPADRLSFVGGAVVPLVLPGRFFPLYGLETLELSGRAAQLGAVSVQWSPVERVFVRAVANAGRAGDALDRFRTGGALTLGATTPVGPAELTLSGAGPGSAGVFVSLGRAF